MLMIQALHEDTVQPMMGRFTPASRECNGNPCPGESMEPPGRETGGKEGAARGSEAAIISLHLYGHRPLSGRCGQAAHRGIGDGGGAGMLGHRERVNCPLFPLPNPPLLKSGAQPRLETCLPLPLPPPRNTHTLGCLREHVPFSGIINLHN